jgi:hypothetical protein
MTEIFEFLIVSEKKGMTVKVIKNTFKQKIHGLSKKRIYDLYKI